MKEIILKLVCDTVMTLFCLLSGVILLSLVVANWGKKDLTWIAVAGLMNIIHAARIWIKN